MGCGAGDRKVFWYFVAEQTDHDDPKGDLIGDRRATLDEGEDPDVPLRSACRAALHEYRKLLQEWQDQTAVASGS